MPEAELPGNEYLPKKNDPVNQQKPGLKNEVEKIRQHLVPEAQTSMPEDDDWETVDFPDAISVDSIPVLETTSAKTEDLILTAQDPREGMSQEVRELEVVLTKDSAEELGSVNLMEALHDCNRELVNRVTELETALEECQQTLENQEKLLEERTRELAKTQQQVTRLFYKLELCSQIIQRQEVLVESLTDKWEKSEQHQAQMERECTLTKQSYNQQTYHLKELENTCRELRSRLYRQQQQTLQLKAALEMPGKINTLDKAIEKLPEPSTVRVSQVGDKSEPLKPKNPFIQTSTKILPLSNSAPVKPWSPQIKNQQKETSFLKKKEITIAKVNLGNKLDLPQGLITTKKVSSSEENTPENNFPGEFSEVTLNPSLSSFSRIGEVLDYELAEETSQKDILEDTEAEEYVVMEDNLTEELSKFQEAEKLSESKVIAEPKKVEDFQEEPNIGIKHERISWNISTGNWNVCEYQPEAEIEINPEINAEYFPEVSEEMQQDVEQTTPMNSKLHLPTWNSPSFESEPFEEEVASEVPEQQHLSLGSIDLPNFPRISIDEQPYVVNS